MQTIDPVQNTAADLYWLAFLLTGQRGLSFDLTVEALGVEDDEPARRIVIKKALAAMRSKLASSARRTAEKRFDERGIPAPDWSLDLNTSKAQIEKALLAMEAFPRCALLLTIFERIELAEAALLLQSPRALVLKGQVAGLRDLTRNLAQIQGWTSKAATLREANSEMQHV